MKHEQEIREALGTLQAQAADWGCSLGTKQLDLLRRYAELLANYDQANVIGSKETRSILLNHVLDSLSCSVLQDVALQGSLIDVGAGGGLPGVPLAITLPSLEVTSLEATEKKVRFLRYAKDELQLWNLSVLNERAEDAGRDKESRDRFDLAVSRALASLPVVVEYCAPFVRSGGWILAMKGRLEEDELLAGKRAAVKLGAELCEVVKISFRPELEQKQRHIVVLRKTRPTPDGYPRRIGLAKKRPLGS